MPNLMDLSNVEFKKELFKENIFIELSERLEIEMNKKSIASSELATFLGKEDFYIDAILEGILDIKLSELAYIFSFFDKFTGIVPVSKEERIKIFNVKEHSFLTFNNTTKKVSVCSKKEFENSNLDVYKRQLDIELGDFARRLGTDINFIHAFHRTRCDNGFFNIATRNRFSQISRFLFVIAREKIISHTSSNEQSE